MKRAITILCLANMMSVGAALGCASHTTKTTKVVTSEQAGDAPRSDDAGTKTVTTTTEDESRSPGIVGSTFQLVWAVISFPFRVIGALF